MIGRPGKCPWKCGSFADTFFSATMRLPGSSAFTRSGGVPFFATIPRNCGSVRSIIGIAKGTTAEWLEVMEAAHRLGMKTTATMMAKSNRPLFEFWHPTKFWLKR